ncbi:uncharacterized protein LOC134775327 [Penaeus indicus]|uniref:uncharacterized protein LOC134775327 n=1 Tax=Penaeus indicus TaxID=29960 RepID=UPI00300C8269
MAPHGGRPVGPPRLTSFLRAYANVSRKGKEDDYDLAQILAIKREQRRQRMKESGVTWPRIKSQVERLGRENGVNLECYLREVADVARQCDSSDSVRVWRV